MVAGTGQFNEADKSTVPKEAPGLLIHFTRTDGDPEFRPSAQQRDRRVVNGEVNFMRTVGVNEPAATLWRKKIGIALAKDLGLDQSKIWYLAGWPVDYELFVHSKGPANSPRLDMYLFGGPARFRSANEFYPHARWLLTAPSLQTTKCDCKYCGNVKYQRQINFREGLGPPIAPDASEERSSISAPPTASGSGTKSRPKRARATRVSSPQQRVDESRFQSVNTYLESDLRSQRNFRLGEVVWVHLEPAIESFTSSRKIVWWPALIQEPRFKTEVLPKIPGQPYAVRQTQVYRVLMLGTTSQYVIPDDAILPFQAYSLPADFVLEITKTVCSKSKPTELDFDRATSFTPLPMPLRMSPGTSITHPSLPPNASLPPIYPEALLPYLGAIYTSRLVSTYWCATDNFEFISLPTPEVPVPVKQTRFQGLWWGGERVWVGDLVRIKPGRGHLTGNLRDPSPGAEKRGLLLKIESIYLDELKKETEGELVDTEWKPMVSGTLYEVARADLIDDAESAENAPSNKLGNGVYVPSPIPPPGFKFRTITPGADFDVHFELCMIAGRYYPHILSSPLVASAAQVTTFTPYNPPNGSSSSQMTLKPNYPPGLLSLAALEPGAVNAIDAVHWREGRIQMLGGARQDMINIFAPKLALPAPQTPIATPPHVTPPLSRPAISEPPRIGSTARSGGAGDGSTRSAVAGSSKPSGASHILSTDAVEARVKQELVDRLFSTDNDHGDSLESAIIID